jgi:uncharacterized OB-fold protein
MPERPQLRMSRWTKGKPMTCECSACGQTFLPPEDRSPKQAMQELLAAFEQHIREMHGDENAIRPRE